MSTFRQKVQATTNWVKPSPEDLEEAPRGARRAAARSRKRPSAPVTAHRLFPAFAAVWFAALFGLGSLAIPGTLLGAIVLKTGLPALVPAAAPPLGFTAHLLVAFLLAGFGAALGLALGLRLRPQGAGEVRPPETAVAAAEPEADDVYKVRARDAHPDAPPRRPLVLTEAFADPLEELAEPAEPLLRRKPSLAVSEPINDAGPWIPEFTPGGVHAVQPLDLSALDLLDPVEESFEEPAEQAAPVIFAPEPEVVMPEVVLLATEEAPAQPEAELEPELQPEPGVQPEEVPAAPALIAATPQLVARFAASLPDRADGTWSPVAGAPLESLGIVQLIERLALAIAAQKASNAAVMEVAPEVEAPEVETPTAALEPAPEPEAAPEPAFEPGPFSRPPLANAEPSGDVPAAGSAREAILHRLGAMAAGDLTGGAERPADAAPLFSRPAPTPAPSAPAEAVFPIRPAAPAFAPPAQSVPPATATPPESDEALRSALATLQRMTARG